MPDYFVHLSAAGAQRVPFPADLPLEDRAAYMLNPPSEVLAVAEAIPAYARALVQGVVETPPPKKSPTKPTPSED